MKRNLENPGFWITKVSNEKLLPFKRIISFLVFLPALSSDQDQQLQLPVMKYSRQGQSPAKSLIRTGSL